LWNAVLENLKSQLPSTTFYTFVADTQLATIDNGVATILTPREGTLEWLTTRLAKKVKLLLTIEAKIAGKNIPIEEVRFEVLSTPDENHQA
jgi:chromosomal replication initiation ATPase DnaA